jgi:hypothetical protein
MPRGKKEDAGQDAPAVEASTEETPKQGARTRTVRKFPALTFEEALFLPDAIQKHAAGLKVRKLTLFEKLNQPPDSDKTRRLITGSAQYGLTKGSYAAEFLELTPEGMLSTSDEATPVQRFESRFNLAIKKFAPFNFLYERLRGNKLPAREIMADSLEEISVGEDERAECIDTFILNAQFLGMLRTIAGSERLVSYDHALEDAAKTPAPPAAQSSSEQIVSASRATADISVPPSPSVQSSVTIHASLAGGEDFAKLCFYITPIGDDGSEPRRHADFLMEYIIKPAVKEFDLTVIRADQMGKPGMIGKQVIEHILKSRLVIADLSFHNPNVFYEICLRHTTRLPIVQLIRAADKIPFDVNQYRTIPIETRDPYTLVPKIQTYIAEVANQLRRALQDDDSSDNPISLYYPSAKLAWDDK